MDTVRRSIAVIAVTEETAASIALHKRLGFTDSGTLSRVGFKHDRWVDCLMLEYSLDPADGDTAHGLIDLGIGMPELGEIKLSDLASIVGPRQQPVMRDRYFRAVRPLSEYLRLAQENGSVLD